MTYLVKPHLAMSAMLTVSIIFVSCTSQVQHTVIEDQSPERVVVGYVTSWSDRMPDPNLVTHLNYAFGHVTTGFDSVRVDNPERLCSIVALKEANPHLKVLLSVGGWGSGNFSEMAADEAHRISFARSCQKAIDTYSLDGIDIDWEYPTSSAAGISSSPDDTKNFTLLMHDLRQAIGSKDLDFINLMTYDMADPPYHHSALFRSDVTGSLSVSEAIDHHLEAGVPLSKLVMGMPFYGRPSKDYKGQRPFGKLSTDGLYTERWDSIALVPYLVDEQGNMVLALENATSITHKCNYILAKGLRGAMYWDCDDDDDSFTLSRAVWNLLMK